MNDLRVFFDRGRGSRAARPVRIVADVAVRVGCVRRIAAIAASALLVMLPAPQGFAQMGAELAPGVPNISGAWERFRGRPGTPGVPPAETDPPLKPEHLEAWEQRRAEARAADARGEPLATGYTFCLPDGMPSMMAGPFPFEFLQSPDQVTPPRRCTSGR
jgi:hypothetical protein